MHYDWYGPRIGPAAMPSPHSRHTPYFSGCRGTLKRFLEEVECKAYGCRLTDLQWVDTLITYVDPYIHEFCNSLDGFPLCDWHQFQYSLINAYGTPILLHKIKRKSYMTLLKTPPDPEWVAKFMSYSTTRTFNTTVLLSFTLAAWQKKTVMQPFGMDSTLSIAKHFSCVSAPGIPSSHIDSRSPLKMYLVVHVKSLSTRNHTHFAHMSFSSNLRAFIVDFPHPHSQCQTLGFPPHFHPHVRPQHQTYGGYTYIWYTVCILLIIASFWCKILKQKLGGPLIISQTAGWSIWSSRDHWQGHFN